MRAAQNRSIDDVCRHIGHLIEAIQRVTASYCGVALSGRIIAPKGSVSASTAAPLITILEGQGH
jgi:hypothetical protein